MRKMTFELCAETIEACRAARDGGAHRIELCSGLSEGGVTPSRGLVRAAIELAGPPIHVLIRPRTGNFYYDESEISLIREDILHVKELGAAGIVVGILRPDSSIDIDATRSLVQLAHPMKVTFHRAFDLTPSLLQALEDVIAIGADRVLTSGGQPDVVAGSAVLAEIVDQANRRIDVAIGGGLRFENAADVARRTRAKHFHGSLQHDIVRTGHAAVHADIVSKMVRCLQNAS